MTTDLETWNKLKKDFAQYTNSNGFVNENGGWMQNDCLYNAFFVAIADRLGALTQVEYNFQRSIYLTLIHKDYPGLLMRNPDNSGGRESHDNTKAMLWVSVRLGINYPKEFLKHGRENGALSNDFDDTNRPKVWKGFFLFWTLRFLAMFFGRAGAVPFNYNNINPRKFHFQSYLGRFQNMVTQAQYAAGETDPGFWREFWLGVGFIMAGKSTKVESKTLTYFMCKTARGKSPMVDKCIDYWRDKTMKQSGGRGLAFFWEQYGWRGHPFVKYYEGIIDV